MADCLREAGIEFRPIAGTGVLARIEGRGDLRRCVVLRADMDALPIEEKTGLEYASRNKGVMHACGHDVHTACLLGAMLVLKRMSERIEERVRAFPARRELARAGVVVLAETRSVTTRSRLS
ncbi:MAG: M20/M25/M40 family metallo-hydrolase [Alistipes ihumii]